MTAVDWKSLLYTPAATRYFDWLYPGIADLQADRYAKLLDSFALEFGQRDVRLFSAPGRSELGGNHTDHQHGRVLAAGVTLDMAAAVSPRSDGIIRLISRGMGKDMVDTADLSVHADEQNHSQSLIRGVCAGFVQNGHTIGGFDAYQISDIPRGSGLSSSAAFEVLIGTILSGLYNGGSIPMPEIARIGQYAENVYFGKPCGLMDQTASAVGGVVSIDFANPDAPVIHQILCDLETAGYRLCIVNAGGSHANLTGEYAAIPAEMKTIAAFFGKTVLREVAEADFYDSLENLRGQVSDRALLRAMHFFFDNACVLRETEALRRGDIAAFCRLMIQSGDSSYNCLQNIFPAFSPDERSVALALALSAHALHNIGGWRVHGGGFAGTIQALVPLEAMDSYIALMERVFGAGCCYPLSVRPLGGLEIPANLVI